MKACPLCTLAPETEDNLIMDCPFSRRLLNEIGCWWCLNIPVGSIESLLNWGQNSNFKGAKLEVFTSIIHTFCWLIWKVRNQVVHGGDKFSIQRSFSLLLGLPYFWLYHRGNCKSKITWHSWCCLPCFLFPV